jgi:hypothetical protein
LPGGSFYDEVDPWVYLWLFYSFIESEQSKHKMYRSMAILQGSFANPDMARRMMQAENPDAEMDDEDFDALSEYILTENIEKENKTKKRKKKLLLKQIEKGK